MLIEIFDKQSKKGDDALLRLEGASDRTVVTTAINLHEVLSGYVKYTKSIATLQQLPVLPFGGKDAELSSKIEVGLERKGTPVRRTDTMIAAVAVNNNARFFSFNAKDFTPMRDFGLRLLE